MINSYLDYLNMSRRITIEDMHEIHLQIRNSIIDEYAEELYDELVKTATKYMEHRMNWLLYTREKKIEQDSYRSSCHDSLLVKINMFTRYIKSIGGDTPWEDILEHSIDGGLDRKKVGDFACYIAFINALNAR